MDRSGGKGNRRPDVASTTFSSASVNNSSSLPYHSLLFTSEVLLQSFEAPRYGSDHLEMIARDCGGIFGPLAPARINLARSRSSR